MLHPQQGASPETTAIWWTASTTPDRWANMERHLEHRIEAQRIGVVAVLVDGADHQQSKTDDVRQAVRDLIGGARIDHAGGERIGEKKTLFDFAQRQNAAIRESRSQSNLTTTGLLEADDRQGSGSIE